MKTLAVAAGIAAVVGAFAFLPVSEANAATAAAQTQAAAPTAFTLTVLTDETGGLIGSDGKRHDSMIPANLVMQKGVKVTLTIVNHDDMIHTITAPGLGLNVIVKAAKKKGDEIVPTVTTVSFTPKKAGDFRWHCVGACDPWTMQKSFDGPDRDGFMAGYFVVI